MANCIYCGDTLKTSLGEPCPVCSGKILKKSASVYNIPIQYQGVSFDKSFLPEKMQKVYGTYMEELLIEIVNNISFYAKNSLICSRPNTGKTIWAYTLYANLYDKGVRIPPLRDIMEVRNLLNGSSEEGEMFSSSKCAIIKIPVDIQFWMIDIMSSVIERRVRNNGFTIFLFGGTEEDITSADKNKRYRYLKGNGSYNSLDVKMFW